MPFSRPLLVFAALIATVLLACTPTTASPVHDAPVVTTTSVTDADDSGGALDVVAVSHSVRERGDTAQVRYTIRLQAPIEAGDLHRRHRLVVGELDTDGRPGAERNITVYGRDSQVHADLISNATREVIRPLHVRLLDGQRIRVRGPRQQVGVRRIFWYSYYHRTGDPSCGWDGGYPVTCSDSVPDDGWLRLPAAAWPSS
jgi:hypothetical protein